MSLASKTLALTPRPFMAFLLAAVCAVPVHAEPLFPTEMTLSESGTTHRLALTGAASRVVLVFTVYDIAHYQVPDRSSSSFTDALVPDDVIADGPAKAIAIRFTRNLGKNRIRSEFEKTIRRNGEELWLNRAAPTIGTFLDAIDRDAQAGDQVVYYWLEGGRLIAEFNGERFFSATDADFAKLIWSIWFGDDPVCDSEALLARSALDVDN